MRLSELAPLYERPGPWASVYLDATGSVPNARRMIAMRWREVRESLSAQGADERTLRAIDERIEFARPPAGPAGWALFATDGTIALDRTLPGPPPRDVGDWSPRPRVATLVRALGELGEEVRWARADVDRTGGAVRTNDGVLPVPGQSTDPIRKVHAGGWSMPRFQRAAETNWDRNSEDVATALAAQADRVHADVIVLTGDVRARQLVRDRLPARLAAALVEVDYESPVRDRPDPALDEATGTAIERAARVRRDALLDRFHAGLADGRSVRGVRLVTAAAREHAIDTLLIGPEGGQRALWVDPGRAAMVATGRRTLGPEAVAEPAADALVGAAVAAGAAAVVIEDDADLVDGLGAVLRYPRR